MSKSFGRAFISLVAVILTTVGCVVHEYVYVDEHGNRVHAGGTEICIRDLSPTTAGDVQVLEGTWWAPAEAISRPQTNVNITWVTTGDAGSRTQSWWIDGRRIDGLPAPVSDGQQVRFRFRFARDAGSLSFEGTGDGQTVKGNVRLVPDAAYNAEVEKLFAKTGRGEIALEQTLQLLLLDVPIAYVRDMVESAAAQDLAEVIKLRRAGVEAVYAREMRDAGYSFKATELIRLRHAGVEASYAAALRKGGLTFDSAEQVVRLRHAGVESSYAVNIARTGLATSPEQIVRLRHAGVEADYVTKLSDAGYHFDADDVVRLRHAGVESSYAVALRKAGYDLDAKQIIRLRHAGVESSYAQALAVPGRQNLDVDQIVNLRHRGIDAQTVQQLRK